MTSDQPYYRHTYIPVLTSWSLYDKSGTKRKEILWRGGIVISKGHMQGWGEDTVMAWCRRLGWTASDY